MLVKDNISSDSNIDNGNGNRNEENALFRLKTLSTDELQEIEYRIRDKISTLYYDCQMKYVEGVQLLDEYYIKREKLEM